MKYRIRTLLLLVSCVAFALLPGAGCSKASKQARHTARGDEYFQKEQFAKAEIEYLSALRLAPKDPILARKIATLYYEQGRSISALRAWSFVRLLQPNDPEVHSRLAHIYMGVHDFGHARQEILSVVTNQSAPAAALLLLAETSFTPAEITQARSLLNRMAQKDGVNTGISVALATLDSRERNFAAAETRLKQIVATPAEQPSLDLALGKLRLAQTNVTEAETLLKRAADASPARSTPRLQWIDYRMLRGDVAGAKQAAEEITRKSPDYVPPWLRLAEISLREQRFDDCNTISKKVMGLDGGSYEGLLMRARMWSAQDQVEKSLDELNRLDSLYPTNSAVWFELAVAHARAGRIPKAMALLDNTLKLNPQFVRASLVRADLNLRSGNSAVAATELATLVKERPEFQEAALLLARAYIAQGRNDAALGLYRQMAVRHPRDPEPHMLIGFMLLRNRDASAARASFQNSLQVSPNYIPAVEQLFEMELRATNYTAALTRANQLASARTNSAAGLLLAARAHAAAKNITAAEAALEQAAVREPDSIAVYSMFAALYYDTKDFKKAIEKLDAIISRNPKAASTWMQKGLMYQLNNQNDKAVDSYRQAVSINKSFSPALNNLAVLLAENPKQLDEALEFANRARAASPTNAYIGDTLGWILYKTRDFNGARRVLTESALNSQNAEIDYHLAMTEYALGDEGNARRHFGQALQGGLPANVRPDAESRLAILNINPASATPQDLPLLEAAAKKEPGDFPVQFRLGSIYQRQGNASKAKSALETALKANPQSAPALNALAQFYADSEPDRAFQYAKDARKIDSSNPSIAATLGSFSVRRHDYATGYALLQEAVRGGISSPRLQYDLAAAQFAVGRVREATAVLASLAETTDASVRQRARDALQVLKEVDPQRRSSLAGARLKSDPKDMFGLVALAETEEAQNRPREAVKAYEAVLASSADFWPSHKRLAVLYADHLKNPKGAQPHALKARAAAPDDAELAHLLGKLAFERGDLPDAVRFLEETTRVQTTNGEPYYLLGVAQYRLKRTNDCRLALSKALARPLAPTAATEAKRLMATLK
jgi:tetratricopeptide (TPR) repeat protein